MQVKFFGHSDKFLHYT